MGKKILKKAAEPYVDGDLIYRKKQGFGAPMDQWFRDERFGKRCLDVYRGSQICKAGYLNNDFFEKLLEAQIAGRSNYGFHLWTVLNAVFWHEHWIRR